MRFLNRDSVGRMASSALFMAAGMYFVWRGYSFIDPLYASLLPEAMCILCAFSFLLSGVVILRRRGENLLD
jgi:hypothetical protein